MPEAGTSDTMDGLAGLIKTDPIFAMRRGRPDVVRYTQACDDAILRPAEDGGFTRSERAAVALSVALALDDMVLTAHYRNGAAGGELGANFQEMTAPAKGGRATTQIEPMLIHARRLTLDPNDAHADHLTTLTQTGRSPHAIVALSQLIAYINYQARVLAGLRMLAAAPANPDQALLTRQRPPSRPMRDFTKAELDWLPWLAPLDLADATAEQRDALKITPSNRAIGAYALVLAHDPSSLAARSPLYNTIMFGPGGLPRADRELGAVVASRINGCAYCASVHATRFTALTKEPEIMARLWSDGVDADLSPRHRAIVDFAGVLTLEPASLIPADSLALRTQGLSEAEILDLTHAVAMFAWANRLMQSLGAAA